MHDRPANISHASRLLPVQLSAFRRWLDFLIDGNDATDQAPSGHTERGGWPATRSMLLLAAVAAARYLLQKG